MNSTEEVQYDVAAFDKEQSKDKDKDQTQGAIAVRKKFPTEIDRPSVLTGEMCYHRLFIYSACGHSVFALDPTVTCAEASTAREGGPSAGCKLQAHPFQSWKINSLCPHCEERRTQLLRSVEATLVLKYDDWRWKVSYGMPAHGKDFWGRKADERAKLEQQTGKRKRFSLPFRWKRTWKTRQGQVEIETPHTVKCAPAISSRRLVH